VSKPGSPQAQRPPASGGVALVASGDEWSLRSLDSILSAHDIGVVRVRTARDAYARAESAGIHVILVDHDVSGVAGVDVCRALRALPGVGASTPIIMLGHRPWRHEERFEALRVGAWACFAIPADSDELLLQLHTFIAARREADERREAGLLDLLTGGYNAAGIERRARELAADAIRFSRPLGCVALSPGAIPEREDGAPPDPTPLNQTIELLRSVLRGSDVVGRIGPADFVILAANAGTAGTQRLAQRLVDAADHLPARTSAPLALRAGYFAVDDLRAASLDPEELVRRAAAALRKSQASAGAERLCTFTPDLSTLPN